MSDFEIKKEGNPLNPVAAGHETAQPRRKKPGEEVDQFYVPIADTAPQKAADTVEISELARLRFEQAAIKKLLEGDELNLEYKRALAAVKDKIAELLKEQV